MKEASGGLETKSIMIEVGVPVKLRVLTDSVAARGMSHRRGVGRVRHLDIKDLWVQAKVQAGELIVDKIDTTQNRGDIGTKALDGIKLTYLMSLTSLRRVADWRTGGLIMALLLEQADGAGTEVQKMILGSSIGWVVDMTLDYIKNVATVQVSMDLWILIVTLIGCVWIGHLSGRSRAARESVADVIDSPVIDEDNMNAAGVLGQEEIVSNAPTLGARPIARTSPLMPTPVPRMMVQNRVPLIQQTPLQAMQHEMIRQQAEIIAAQDARAEREAMFRRNTVVELKGELRRRHLPVSGLKEGLVRRLCDSMD